MNIFRISKIASHLSIGSQDPPVTAGTVRCDSGHRFSGQQLSKIHNWSGVFKHWQCVQ